MYARLFTLAALVFVAAGCTSNGTTNDRPIPSFDPPHRAEQINSPGTR